MFFGFWFLDWTGVGLGVVISTGSGCFTLIFIDLIFILFFFTLTICFSGIISGISTSTSGSIAVFSSISGVISSFFSFY